MPGPQPEPTNIKALRGNPGRRPLNNDPEYATLDIVPPEELTDLAKKEWKRLAPQLIANGLLTAADLQTFSGYCEAVSIFKASCADIKARGILVDGARGKELVRNPSLMIRDAVAKDILQYSARFGLTPSDRARISAKPAQELDEFQQIAEGFDL